MGVCEGRDGGSDAPGRQRRGGYADLLEQGEGGLFLSLFVLFTFASVYLRAEFIYVVGCESGWRWGRQGEKLVEGCREAERLGCVTSERMWDLRAARLES